MAKTPEATARKGPDRRRSTRKLGNGQGSITEVRRGVWRVRAPVCGYTESGSPIQPGATVHGSKGDALAKLDELRGAKRAGTLSTSTGTMADFLTRWIETSSARWSPATTRRNTGTVTMVTAELGTTLKLRELSAGHLAALYASLTRKKKSAATVVRVHAVISRALADAVAWGEVGVSPAPKAKAARPRVTRDEPRPATKEEADAIIREGELTGPLWGDLFGLAAASGLRRGELVALRWQDIDTKARRIVVAHSLAYRNRGDWQLVPTKGRKVRRVPMTQSAATILERRFDLASSTAPGAFVFSEANDGRTPIDPDRASKVAKAARDAAEISDDLDPLHGLRGYCCTVIGSKVSAREAQAWLGHDSITTTERYLGRVRDDESKAIAALDADRKALPAAG